MEEKGDEKRPSTRSIRLSYNNDNSDQNTRQCFNASTKRISIAKVQKAVGQIEIEGRS